MYPILTHIPSSASFPPIVQRLYSNNFLLSANEVGRKPSTFAEASFVAQEILNSNYDFQVARIFYNKFKSAVSYNVEARIVPSATSLDGRGE